jgi:hypothetical protein
MPPLELSRAQSGQGGDFARAVELLETQLFA